MRKILGVFGILTALVASVFPQVVEASVVHQKFAHGTYAPRTASVTICIGVGAQYVKPPSGYVVTSVGVAGPSYNACGANNTSGINSQVWAQLKSGTTVCVGMGSPSTVLPSGYVVTKVSASGPPYNLGPCGANSGLGINSQVWTHLKNDATVCVGAGSPAVVPPSGYAVTSVGSAGPPYNLGPCGANNGSGINSQVWSLKYGIL